MRTSILKLIRFPKENFRLKFWKRQGLEFIINRFCSFVDNTSSNKRRNVIVPNITDGSNRHQCVCFIFILHIVSWVINRCNSNILLNSNIEFYNLRIIITNAVSNMTAISNHFVLTQVIRIKRFGKGISSSTSRSQCVLYGLFVNTSIRRKNLNGKHSRIFGFKYPHISKGCFWS